MNRITTAATLMLFSVASNAAFADETTFRRDCRRDAYGNSNCTLTISRPPISEPFYRSPGTEETVVVYPRRETSSSPSPSLPSDNFCGPGFRMLPDASCELK